MDRCQNGIPVVPVLALGSKIPSEVEGPPNPRPSTAWTGHPQEVRFRLGHPSGHRTRRVPHSSPILAWVGMFILDTLGRKVKILPCCVVLSFFPQRRTDLEVCVRLGLRVLYGCSQMLCVVEKALRCGFSDHYRKTRFARVFIEIAKRILQRFVVCQRRMRWCVEGPSFLLQYGRILPIIDRFEAEYDGLLVPAKPGAVPIALFLQDCVSSKNENLADRFC